MIFERFLEMALLFSFLKGEFIQITFYSTNKISNWSTCVATCMYYYILKSMLGTISQYLFVRFDTFISTIDSR